MFVNHKKQVMLVQSRYSHIGNKTHLHVSTAQTLIIKHNNTTHNKKNITKEHKLFFFKSYVKMTDTDSPLSKTTQSL